MQQGLLFEPEVLARTELQDAIARLDFHSAVRRLEEFHRFWPEAKPTWEPELVCAGSRMAAKPMDLDSGYGAWRKLEARLNTLDVSRSWTASLRRNFFSRLLASNRKLFEEPRIRSSQAHQQCSTSSCGCAIAASFPREKSRSHYSDNTVWLVRSVQLNIRVGAVFGR